MTRRNVMHSASECEFLDTARNGQYVGALEKTFSQLASGPDGGGSGERDVRKEAEAEVLAVARRRHRPHGGRRGGRRGPYVGRLVELERRGQGRRGRRQEGRRDHQGLRLVVLADDA